MQGPIGKSAVDHPRKNAPVFPGDIVPFRTIFLITSLTFVLDGEQSNERYTGMYYMYSVQTWGFVLLCIGNICSPLG
jgi:hypothetical protein